MFFNSVKKFQWRMAGYICSTGFAVCSSSAIFSFIFSEELDQPIFLSELSTATLFFVAVIFAPIFETVVFQFAPIELILLLFRKLNFRGGAVVAVAASSALFASNHNYNVEYVVFAMIMGIILAVSYLYGRKNSLFPFVVVLFSHMLNNFLAFVFS